MDTATAELQLSTYKPEFNADVRRLCDLFVDESLGEFGLTMSQERLDQMIEVCKDISFFLLRDGKPVGLIAGLAVSNLTNGNPALQEVIWYVDPDHRREGVRLLRAFEDKAKELGMSAIVMALMVNSMGPALDRFYRKNGYRQFEVQYIKEL